MKKFLATCLAILAFLALACIPTAAEGPLAGQLICLDPGHGGSDPGAVNELYGLYESEINLDVSLALKGLLEGQGAEVLLTRTDDSYLTNRDRYTYCNEQKATLLLSVHTNSVEDSVMDGTMTLYFKPEDKVFAEVLQGVVYPALKEYAPAPEAFTDWGLNRYASGVLLKSDMPAAIAEPLFMSNEAEAALLAQTIQDGCQDISCRRGQIAQALADGVLQYFSGSPAPTPTPSPGGTMRVAAITMSYAAKGPNYMVYTGVAVVDADGNPVPDVSVSLNTILPDNSTVASSATTSSDGLAAFQLRSRQSGVYRAEVTALVKDGWDYDAAGSTAQAEIQVPQVDG